MVNRNWRTRIILSKTARIKYEYEVAKNIGYFVIEPQATDWDEDEAVASDAEMEEMRQSAKHEPNASVSPVRGHIR